MQPFLWVIVVIALLVGANAHAQIYTCRAADGTRIFSDERCGPDAKVMPGMISKKRSGAKTEPLPKPARAPARTGAELEELLKRCDAGDVSACNAWTSGGGPNQLREKERQAQLACDGGSLPACEERYCSDGASAQCRTRVLQAAKLAGNTWYLRDEGKRLPDGATRYTIRCIWEGESATRDLNVTCAEKAGPQRCSDASAQAFARLDAAASSYCARSRFPQAWK
jgi:hypothetical protein